EFTLAPVEDGFHLAGWLNPVNGALLQEALSSHMGRKAADDLRPINERRADGLISLAAQSLDSGVKMPSARIRPHLTVTMEYDTIERLVHASGPLAPQSDRTCDGTEPFDEGLWAQQWRPGDDHVISTTLDYSKLEGTAPATLPDGTPLPQECSQRLPAIRCSRESFSAPNPPFLMPGARNGSSRLIKCGPSSLETGLVDIPAAMRAPGLARSTIR